MNNSHSLSGYTSLEMHSFWIKAAIPLCFFLQAEVQLCYLEAQRDAVEQMSLKLYSEQYTSGSKRKEEFADMSKVHAVGGTGQGTTLCVVLSSLTFTFSVILHWRV